MKKRYSVMFLVFGLLVALSLTKVPTSYAAYTLETDGFWESFDNKITGNFVNGDGWTNHNYFGGIASIVEEPDAANKSLKLVDSDFETGNEYRFGAYAYKEGFGGLRGKVVFETRFKVKELDGVIPSYNIELLGGTQKVARFLQYSSGYYGIKTLSDASEHSYSIPNGATGSKMPKDQWVTLKMVIDTGAKTYDLTVQSDSLKTYDGNVESQATLDKTSGTFNKSGIPLYSGFTGTDITKVQIYSNFNKGEMFFDYIALYEEVKVPEAMITAPNTVNALDEFQVEIGVKDVVGTKAEDITIDYDPNLFDYIEAVGIVDGGSSTVINNVYHEASTGNIRIIASNQGEENVINGEAQVAKLTFKAKNVSAAGQISITNATVADASGAETIINLRGSATVNVAEIDGSDLISLISTTTALSNSAEEGINNGAFIPGMLSSLKTTLQQAIDAAQLVADNNNATAQEMDAAILALTNARNHFESKRITALTGDINQSQNISVGDLGLCVGYYGKTATDSDWLAVKVADINEDGIVNTEDLLFISKRITAVN